MRDTRQITAPEDLKIGQHVAIVKMKIELPECSMPWERPQHIRYDGVPLRILAVSLPFVSVTNGRSVIALDLREVDVRRLTPHYVKQMTSTSEVRSRKQKNKKRKKDARACPRCEGRMIERLIVEAGKENTWVLVCPQCGLSGDLSPRG
jgi:predicted RNA-binding Zn-ribbon protein involved in translation (DUF1610 family)